MAIIYQNINEEKITTQQLSSLNEYNKVFIENQIIIKKEFYINNVLQHISHYKNTLETENEIISRYSNMDVFYAIIQKINLNNFVIEIIKEYSGKILTSHSRYLYNINTNLIGVEHIDLSTGFPKFKETEKYFYDFEKDDYFPVITASYNEDGSLDMIQYDSYRFDGQDEVIFTGDGSSGVNDIVTLKKLLNLSSDEMNYYLTAKLEP